MCFPRHKFQQKNCNNCPPEENNGGVTKYMIHFILHRPSLQASFFHLASKDLTKEKRTAIRGIFHQLEISKVAKIFK